MLLLNISIFYGFGQDRARWFGGFYLSRAHPVLRLAHVSHAPGEYFAKIAVHKIEVRRA